MAPLAWAVSSAQDVPPAIVQPLCNAFVEGLVSVLGKKLSGVYIYGAITFPEKMWPVKDLDYHVIVEAPLTDAERDGIELLREALAREYPPPSDDLDGYVITLEDARGKSPPRHQMWPRSRVSHDESWALHCAHIRTGRRFVLLGPDPLTIYPEPGELDIERALDREIRYVTDHLEDAPAYCVLNLCRLAYSFETKDVVTSKQAAAEWALLTLPPRWYALIEAAQRWYRDLQLPEESALLAGEVGPFFDFAQDRIARHRLAWQS
jgi:Domain of unknown function (DUF4111)